MMFHYDDSWIWCNVIIIKLGTFDRMSISTLTVPFCLVRMKATSYFDNMIPERRAKVGIQYKTMFNTQAPMKDSKTPLHNLASR